MNVNTLTHYAKGVGPVNLNSRRLNRLGKAIHDLLRELEPGTAVGAHLFFDRRRLSDAYPRRALGLSLLRFATSATRQGYSECGVPEAGRLRCREANTKIIRRQDRRGCETIH